MFWETDTLIKSKFDKKRFRFDIFSSTNNILAITIQHAIDTKNSYQLETVIITIKDTSDIDKVDQLISNQIPGDGSLASQFIQLYKQSKLDIKYLSNYADNSGWTTFNLAYKHENFSFESYQKLTQFLFDFDKNTQSIHENLRALLLQNTEHYFLHI